jgi:hypothetical protein
MEAKIKIEIEINGKVETISYEDGLAIYNELKKIYDRTITIGGRDFLKYDPNQLLPWRPTTDKPPVVMMYGVQTPPEGSTSCKED